MKHVKSFQINEQSDSKITVRVKDIIKYLEDNFDPEAEVFLDHDGWMSEYIPANDVLDLIKQRGILQNWRGKLFIQN